MDDGGTVTTATTSTTVTTLTTLTTLTTPERIRAAGLRVTGPRVAVLEALYAVPHSDVDGLLTAVRSSTDVSTQAVYDVLAAFTRVGLVRRIELPGSSARFETRVGDNHHHLVCRGCGTIVDIECATGSAPCLDPVDDHSFLIDEAEVTYWGLCLDCQSSTQHDSPRRQPATTT
jgi:Fe2+ or Zn2+ uptake regulation protein